MRTITDTSLKQVKAILQQLAQTELCEAWVLAEQVPEKRLEKYDSYLPKNLLLRGYASQAFDIPATQEWLQQFADTKPESEQT